MLLKNKNVLITGAGKGTFGESALKNFVKKHANVYALIRNKKDNYKFKNLKNVKIFNGSVSSGQLINKILSQSSKDEKNNQLFSK